MLKKIIGACAIAAATVAAPAHARAEWVRLGETSTDTVYADTSSIQKYRDNIFSIWIKFDRHRISRTGESYSLSQQVIDCNDYTTAVTAITSYRNNGTVIDSFNYDGDDWDGLVPGSAFGQTFIDLCTRLNREKTW